MITAIVGVVAFVVGAMIGKDRVVKELGRFVGRFKK